MTCRKTLHPGAFALFIVFFLAELKPAFGAIDIKTIIQEMGDAIVNIYVIKRDGKIAAASGIVADENGKIVTNFHVVEDAREIAVKLKNEDIYDKVEILDFDEDKDIAVLRVKAPKLVSAVLGDSDEIQVGEDVIALGNPEGLENSVSRGIISGVRKTGLGYKVIQTDASISFGSSGGALVNEKGEVIGIVSFGIASELGANLNFALPINYALPYLESSEAMTVEDFVKSSAGKIGAEGCPKNFSRIPAGKFVMGSPNGERGREKDETPHEVSITRDFCIGQYELTQSEWADVTGSNPSWFKNCGPDCPVEYVSFADAQMFVQMYNQANGGGFRLPTEAEWEYAARAGEAAALSTGDLTMTDCSLDPAMSRAGWNCNSSGGVPHPVGEKSPNAWGLYDTAGNVWEWTQDVYGKYPQEPSTDPVYTGKGKHRVIRGCSWHDEARMCRSAFRGRIEDQERLGNLGFRLARDIPENLKTAEEKDKKSGPDEALNETSPVEKTGLEQDGREK